jgi:hypothetical protein
MRVWPLGVALWGEASSRHLLRWLKTVVVSEMEKAPVEASGRDREGVASQPAKCRKGSWLTSKPGYLNCSGIGLAVTHLLARRCPAYRRRELDLRLSRGTWEGGADTAVRG